MQREGVEHEQAQRHGQGEHRPSVRPARVAQVITQAHSLFGVRTESIYRAHNPDHHLPRRKSCHNRCRYPPVPAQRAERRLNEFSDPPQQAVFELGRTFLGGETAQRGLHVLRVLDLPGQHCASLAEILLDSLRAGEIAERPDHQAGGCNHRARTRQKHPRAAEKLQPEHAEIGPAEGRHFHQKGSACATQGDPARE